MKIIRSVRDTRGNVIQKQPEGGVGRIRCMKCQSLCVEQQLPDGKTVTSCVSCGSNYTTRPLDAPKDPRPGEVPRRPAR